MAASGETSKRPIVAKSAQPVSLRATVSVLGLCMALGVLAAAYRQTVEEAHRAEQIRAASAGQVGRGAGGEGSERDQSAPLMEAGAFGSLSGQLVPADGGAVVQVYRRDGSASKYAFADPNSGTFTVPELPVDVYRVVVRPENPALEPRVIEDVLVPWGNQEDLGAIDLRPEAERERDVSGDYEGIPPASESEVFAEEGAVAGD
jgi:hypothetical protein